MKRKLVYIFCSVAILGALLTGCREKREVTSEKTAIEEAQDLGTGTEEECETEETEDPDYAG